MKAQLLLLITLLGFATACTTSAVKLSPEETQSFFTEHPELNRARGEGVNKVYAQSCETKSGPCRKIECIGSNCWKTEMATPPEGMIEQATDLPSVSKVKCESTEESNAVRRKGCLEYIAYLGEIKAIADSVYALKIMCDLNGVNCQKNFKKFGTGNLRMSDDERSHYKSGQLKVYTYASSGAKSLVVYDYSVLQE